MSEPPISDSFSATLAAVQRVLTHFSSQGVIIERVQFWVEQFAEVLEMPELWTDIAHLRDRGKPGQRRKGT